MSDSEEAPTDERRNASRPAPQPGERAMFTIFRAVAERVRGFHAAVGALLFAAVGLIMIGGFGFALLADEVMEGGPQQVDDAILLWMNRHASPALTGFALDFTALGS